MKKLLQAIPGFIAIMILAYLLLCFINWSMVPEWNDEARILIACFVFILIIAATLKQKK